MMEKNNVFNKRCWENWIPTKTPYSCHSFSVLTPNTYFIICSHFYISLLFLLVSLFYLTHFHFHMDTKLYLFSLLLLCVLSPITFTGSHIYV